MDSRFRELVIKKIKQNVHKLKDDDLFEIVAKIDQVSKNQEYVQEYVKTGMMMGE